MRVLVKLRENYRVSQSFSKTIYSNLNLDLRINVSYHFLQQICEFRADIALVWRNRFSNNLRWESWNRDLGGSASCEIGLRQLVYTKTGSNFNLNKFHCCLLYWFSTCTDSLDGQSPELIRCIRMRNPFLAVRMLKSWPNRKFEKGEPVYMRDEGGKFQTEFGNRDLWHESWTKAFEQIWWQLGFS